jgi:hypothetical protein
MRRPPAGRMQHLARTLDDEGTNTTGDIGRIELGGVRYLVTFAAKGRYRQEPSAGGAWPGFKPSEALRKMAA